MLPQSWLHLENLVFWWYARFPFIPAEHEDLLEHDRPETGGVTGGGQPAMQKRDALGQRQACAPQPARHAAAVQDGMGALNFIYNSIGLFYNGHCIIFFTRLRAAKASGAGNDASIIHLARTARAFL